METKAAVQLGTLGGGNHFMEAQVDENSYIWLMVHSGSRRTGLEIANHYHKLAIEESALRGLDTPKDVASLSTNEQTGNDYWHDMVWALSFARENRLRMLKKMAAAFFNQAHVLVNDHYVEDLRI